MSNLSLYLVSVLIWGSTWIAITYQYGRVAPEVSVAYRFGLAALLLLGWCLLRGIRGRNKTPRRRDEVSRDAPQGRARRATWFVVQGT